MNSQIKKFTDVENVGMIDSVFRGSLSFAIILSVLLIPAISSSVMAALTLIAIYTGLTAFISWDPFYALMKGPKYQRPERLDVSAPVSADPKLKALATGDHLDKKAA